MTKGERRQVMTKVTKLLRIHNEAVVASVVRKLSSGGVDPDEYDLTDYSLPRVLLTSALHDHKDDCPPLFRPHQKDVENLSHF